jgi:hypothetical protein
MIQQDKDTTDVYSENTRGRKRPSSEKDGLWFAVMETCFDADCNG